MSHPLTTEEYNPADDREPDTKAIDEALEEEVPQVYFDGKYIRGVGSEVDEDSVPQVIFDGKYIRGV